MPTIDADIGFIKDKPVQHFGALRIRGIVLPSPTQAALAVPTKEKITIKTRLNTKNNFVVFISCKLLIIYYIFNYTPNQQYCQ